MTDLIGHNLVDGDSGMNVRPGGFLYAHAGQESATGTRVISSPIRPGSGVDMVQPGEDLQLVSHLLQRLHRAAELEIRSSLLRPPIILNCSVREVNERHPQRCSGGSGCQLTGRLPNRCAQAEGPERFEGGKRQTSAEATKKMAPAQTGVSLSGGFVVQRIVFFHIRIEKFPRLAER